MTIEFQTDAQKECYERVSGWMKEIYGEQLFTADDMPAFIIGAGSAPVFIQVHPLGEDESIVQITSNVVRGAEIGPDLLEYLLKENRKSTLFGAFGITDDGSIALGTEILGTTCVKQELKEVLTVIGNMADNYDDQIMSRWGGLRWVDED